MLKKAVHLDPNRRYDEVSEFTYSLRNPNKRDLDARPVPLIERNPLLFWQCLSLLLAGVVLFLLYLHYGK